LDWCIATNKDYQSAIVLDRKQCPADPLTVKEITAINDTRFRVTEKGTELRDHTTNDPVLIDGVQVVCGGNWGAASTVLQLFRSALSKLHKHYPTTNNGSYIPTCDQCKNVPKEKAKSDEGCHRHQWDARIWLHGSVTKSRKFLTNLSILDTYYVENIYET
jgi:hypothetical protein